MKHKQTKETSAKRTSIRKWFRYHHWKTLPIYENHSDFINCLRCLEDYGDFNTDDCNGLQDSWNAMNLAITNLKEEQVNELHRLIQQTKYNR